MDEKTELLICLGAATAVNCVPCFEYYYGKASGAGLDTDQILMAVELASKVRTGAGIFMKKSIRDLTGCGGEPDRKDCTAAHPCCH